MSETSNNQPTSKHLFNIWIYDTVFSIIWFPQWIRLQLLNPQHINETFWVRITEMRIISWYFVSLHNLYAITEWGIIVLKLQGWEFVIAYNVDMANVGLIRSVEGWEVALFFSLISSHMPLGWLIHQSAPAQGPCEPPAAAEWINVVTIPACPDITQRRQKEEDRPDRCEKHQHLSGLFAVVYPSCTALSDMAKKGKRWGWLRVNLWSCWFAAEWQMDREDKQEQCACSYETYAPKQRAPCHRDYSIFLWIMPQHCAHVKTHTRRLTPPRAGRGYKSNK